LLRIGKTAQSKDNVYEGGKMTLDLSISHTPPGTDLSITLATVKDVSLLIAALRIAIAEAEIGAAKAANPISAKGFRTKAGYLQACLDDIVHQATLPTSVRAVPVH
jgi:hypothetical protein